MRKEDFLEGIAVSSDMCRLMLANPLTWPAGMVMMACANHALMAVSAIDHAFGHRPDYGLGKYSDIE